MLNYDPFIMEDPHFGALIRAEAQARAEVMAEARAEVIAEARAEVIAEARAEVIAEARAEVIAEARAEVLTIAFSKNALIQIVEARFPALATSIDKAVLPDKLDELDSLLVKVATASNEEVTRQLLGLPAD